MHASRSLQVRIRALFSRHVRSASSAALLQQPAPFPPEYQLKPSKGRTRRRGAHLAVREPRKPSSIEQLEKSVQALEQAATSEISSTQPLSFTEEDLLAIYEDLIRIPGQQQTEEHLRIESAKPHEQLSSAETNDALTVNDILMRLDSMLTADTQEGEAMSPFLRSLRPAAEFESRASFSAPPVMQQPTEPHRLALTRIHQVLSRLDAVRSLTEPSSSSTPPRFNNSTLVDFTNAPDDEALRVAVAEQAAPLISPSVLSRNELEALFRTCLAENDAEAAELALDIAKQTNNGPSEVAINDVLSLYAKRGDVQSTERILTRYIVDGTPTPTQIHLHVKSHLRSVFPTQHPKSALRVLHAYEANTVPLPDSNQTLSAETSKSPKGKLTPPLKTYNSLITHLFSCSTTESRAHAWDLFAHMRYVSHPNPDERMYALMIRACAYPNMPGAVVGGGAPARADDSAQENRPEQTSPYPHIPSLSGTTLVGPERAMDLWLEMTQDRGIVPSKGAYDAIVLACARSGEEKWIREGWRMVERMKDEGRKRGKASAQSSKQDEVSEAFAPDQRTLLALLEGTKRIGDLGRTRWILAEMVKGGGVVCEDAMVHVFHAYAAYRPPFRRREALLVGEDEEDGIASASHSSSPPMTTEEARASSSLEPQNQGEDSSPSALTSPHDLQSGFSPFPPQTRSEILSEVQALFHHILVDHGILGSSSTINAPSSSSPMERAPFRGVQVTTRLLNAYMAVHYAHTDMESIKKLYETLYAHLPRPSSPSTSLSPMTSDQEVHSSLSTHSPSLNLAPPNALTYVELLERCSTAWKRDRSSVQSFAENIVWRDWFEYERANAGAVRGVERSSRIGARFIERANVAMIRVRARSNDVQGALALIQRFLTLYPPTDLLLHLPQTKPHYRSTRTALVGARPLVHMSSSAEIPDDAVPPFLTFRDLRSVHTELVRKMGERGEAKKGLGMIKFVCKAYEARLRERRERVVRARAGEEDEESVGQI